MVRTTAHGKWQGNQISRVYSKETRDKGTWHGLSSKRHGVRHKWQGALGKADRQEPEEKWLKKLRIHKDSFRLSL